MIITLLHTVLLQYKFRESCYCGRSTYTTISGVQGDIKGTPNPGLNVQVRPGLLKNDQ